VCSSDLAHCNQLAISKALLPCPCLQWVNLSLLLLFGGMGLGFVRGLARCASEMSGSSAAYSFCLCSCCYSVAGGSVLSGFWPVSNRLPPPYCPSAAERRLRPSTGQPRRQRPWAKQHWPLAACWLGAGGAKPASVVGRASRRKASRRPGSREHSSSSGGVNGSSSRSKSSSSSSSNGGSGSKRQLERSASGCPGCMCVCVIPAWSLALPCPL